ncbi:AraC family ligand binding domain-containing protein [Flammeovirga sp. EKP202]|uniref:AraC family ligand binding domain-containing protein n=1 Tax=Flammeovirga sp. EKP202 TaxID=2770592 RepID=UPI00165F5885|nr:AraC family ligand binding domain-containing protein [Flammeovirga sp. EKP202]MBD0402965.1 AraC family ligand binding domain-containing protein [Flammeovirga sp. EKP202]
MKTSSLFDNLEFNESKPLITVLFETNFTKEIRIAMAQGTVMKEHKTSFPIVVEMVDGNVDFGVEQRNLQLKKGDILALESNVPHDLKATEDSVIRLTLTKYDSSERVEGVAKK